MKQFYNLLINCILSGVTNAFVWFAITFWVYIETQSVMLTSFIAGIFMVCNLLSAYTFGKYVDNNKKKKVLWVSTLGSTLCFILASVVYFGGQLVTNSNSTSPTLWLFIVLCIAGSVSGNLRNIALTVSVNLFFDEKNRDKGNGMVGTVQGMVMGLTSVLSGLAIGFVGMGNSLYMVLGACAVVLLHLLTVRIPEAKLIHNDPQKIANFKKTLQYIVAIPGLIMLIFFTTINNFLGGVFMSLMDAYGLSLVSVQTWGIIWGALSFVFVISGLLIAKYGVGKNPVRTMIIANFLVWLVCIPFTWFSSIYIFLLGVIVWMLISPFIESSEHTIIQKIIPYKNQGKVVGFAQTVESSAMPLTAFFVGPITEKFMIPFMNSGWGSQNLSFLYGNGNIAGIGLVFSMAGVVGVVVTLWARKTQAYKNLSNIFNLNVPHS